MYDDIVTTLTEEQCWGFLDQHEFGRLAFHLVGEVHITPINYCADEGAIYFKTAEGSKLLGITMNEDVAFEVDDFAAGGQTATSVIVRGKAKQIEGEEKAKAEQLPLRPWVPTQKNEVVRIEVNEISGRQFELSKPWTSMRG